VSSHRGSRRQPVMNPAKGPKARAVQAYKPPSFGYREDRKITQIDSGRNIVRPPNTHTTNELGPTAAAMAVHCRVQLAVTRKRVTSVTPRVRCSCGGADAEFIGPLQAMMFLWPRGDTQATPVGPRTTDVAATEAV
jgi:hypothetical protein